MSVDEPQPRDRQHLSFEKKLRLIEHQIGVYLPKKLVKALFVGIFDPVDGNPVGAGAPAYAPGIALAKQPGAGVDGQSGKESQRFEK